MSEATKFAAISIGLASPREIRAWSRGEVKKPETINYRTFKPEREGLFCERIFGPSRDWECHCGKYKKVKFKGIICDRCGVEVTRAKVRRRRMGHIELASTAVHIWYLKGVPSPISLLLDMSARLLEKVGYFASYIVTQVDREKTERRWDDIVAAAAEEKVALREEADTRIQEARRQYEDYLRRGAEQEEGEEEAGGEEDDDEDDEEAEGEEGRQGADLAAEFFGLPTGPQVTSEEDLSHRVQQENEAVDDHCRELDNAVKLLQDLEPKQLITEIDYRSLLMLVEICESRLEGNFRDLFHAGLGGAAIKELLRQIDLDELAHELRVEIEERTGARRARAIKRLQVVEAFRKSKNRPEWMCLDVIPVLPPELRPMVQLDGGRFATSDLNDLYRRIINRNNRLKRIIEIKAPESIINHERRLLQEAVDALIDNSRRSRPVTGSNKRPLKSLSDMLKGKEGRFRKNLLGKRVDYSGRSVIVVGPELELHQCGLPREMALELFKPFVMKRLVEKGYTTNIKTAKRMVDRLKSEVWDALEEVIQEHPILLNRAPTLHRLGIQAFEPVLVDGKAIQVHPLVCQAFNADFDGDQMAAHVPLSAHAQAEARLLMLSSRNIFKPADGRPIVSPLYDIVLGCYYLTQQSEGAQGEGSVYANPAQAILAYDLGDLDLHAAVKVRIAEVFVEAELEEEPVELNRELMGLLRALVAKASQAAGREPEPFGYEVTVTKTMAAGRASLREPEADSDDGEPAFHLEFEVRRAVMAAAVRGVVAPGTVIRYGLRRRLVDTSVGRVIFNDCLPLDIQFINSEVEKNELSDITERLFAAYGSEETAVVLDRMKSLGFKYATRSGLSISLNETSVPNERDTIIGEAEARVEQVNEQYQDGLITAGEREQRVLELWTNAREGVADSILANIDRFNPIWMMISSGARAKRTHICQISGMRGLMSDPFGRLIEDLPVKGNFHEGLNVLEYFVSTHGARKGLADVALRTADAGYLTRRLVDVAQDVIVRASDCDTTQGIVVTPMYEEELHCPSCGQEDVCRTGECEFCGGELSRPAHDEVLQTLEQRITGRNTAEDVVDPETGEVLVAANEEITAELAEAIGKAGIVRLRIRSPLTCELRHGICARCYGRDLATGQDVDTGTAVGIIAAQSIGEPGTQLTMRTFHTGGIGQVYITGVAEVKKKKQEALRGLHEDIDRGLVSLEAGAERERTKAIQAMLKVLEDPIHGLLRVVELFEARKPKGEAITALVDGRVEAIETKGLRTVVIHSDQPLDDPKALRGERPVGDVRHPKTRKSLAEAGEKLTEKLVRRMKKAGLKTVKIQTSHLVPYRGRLHVRPGQEVRAGDRLTDGPLDPQKVLAMKGVEGVQEYLLREIQRVYKSQGVEINDKHIEVIVRQMLKKRKIRDHGDTDFLAGQVVDRFEFEAENARVRELGGREATADWVLLGITEASLATESFLSAASFQRTTRVLAEAATAGKRDRLRGLKENVIIGRLIPAGSGMPSHRDTVVVAPDTGEVLEERRELTPEEAAGELALALDAEQDELPTGA